MSETREFQRAPSHWTYLSQVERRLRSPRLENLLELAHGLGTTAGALTDGLQASAGE